MPYPTSQSKLRLARALDQMTAALEILDEIGAPSEIGATLDLAIAKLQRALGREDDGANVIQALFSRLEDELSRRYGGPGVPPNPWDVPPV